jgi:hypothetical protein
MGIGLIGMMVGSLTGLSMKLLLGEPQTKDNWRVPVIVAGLSSSVAGSMIAYMLVAMIFQIDR